MALPEQGGNECMATCREERRLCMQEERRRGGDETRCDREFEACRAHCAPPPPPPETFLACSGGACAYVTIAQAADKLACVGKKEGDACEKGIETVLACWGGKCMDVPTAQASADAVAACKGKKKADECTIIPQKRLGCRGGTCKLLTDATTEEFNLCSGKAAGDSCTTTICDDDGDCPTGYICKAGKCIKKGGCTKDSECPAGKVCKNGNCVKKGGDGDGDGEQFAWSPEIKALLARILDRANSLLDQPLGLSDEERQAIYNRIFEKIKGMERPAIQSAMNVTSRQGLLGSPYAERGITGIQRGTREQLAAAERDIQIQEAQDRYQQLLGTTGMAQSLLGTGMGAAQLVEAANAARRGEGTGSLNSILQYLISLGGQNAGYYQALLNWLTQHQG
jgi:Cys-rich repeat protein